MKRLDGSHCVGYLFSNQSATVANIQSKHCAPTGNRSFGETSSLTSRVGLAHEMQFRMGTVLVTRCRKSVVRSDSSKFDEKLTQNSLTPVRGLVSKGHFGSWSKLQSGPPMRFGSMSEDPSGVPPTGVGELHSERQLETTDTLQLAEIILQLSITVCKDAPCVGSNGRKLDPPLKDRVSTVGLFYMVQIPLSSKYSKEPRPVRFRPSPVIFA